MKFLILTLVFLSNCAYKPKDDEVQRRLQSQRHELQVIEQEVDGQKYEEGLKNIESFRKKYNLSPFYQSSRVVEARALFGMGNFSEAIKVYEDIQSSSISRNNEIWSQARYEVTAVYEAIGDKVKALSILLALEKGEHPLSEDILYAEVPARIAALYVSLGNEKEAKTYLDKADRGLKFLVAKKGMEKNKDLFSKSLFRMGSVANTQIDEQNFSEYMMAQRRSQVYMVKAMELNAPIWSRRASEDLIKTYRDCWSFIQSQWSGPESTIKKINGLKDLHALITESLYRQPGEENLWNENLRLYFSFATQLEAQISQQLYSHQATMPLTTPLTTPLSLPPKKEPTDLKNLDPNLR